MTSNTKPPWYSVTISVYRVAAVILAMPVWLSMVLVAMCYLADHYLREPKIVSLMVFLGLLGWVVVSVVGVILVLGVIEKIPNFTVTIGKRKPKTTLPKVVVVAVKKQPTT